MKNTPVRFLIALTCACPALVLSAVHPIFESGPIEPPPATPSTPSEQIDRLVFDQLAKLEVTPANLCSDAVFLRRAHLCVIGTLPTEAETRAFLDATDPDHRSQLIDDLLRRKEFADYWAMKWGDLLRVKAEFPIKLWPNAVQAYHRWIHTSLRDNKPVHDFVRQMLVGNGSNFREGEVNFYRAMQDRSPRGIASTVALTFLGERAEKWPTKKLDALAGFFGQVNFKPTAEWKEEIVYFDPMADEKELWRNAMFPDGTPANLKMGLQDPRVVFADWLLRPENPWFSRNIANRAWSWLMGRGIVHEPDDHHADNPPANAPLLAFLEKEFASSRCDLKHLFRIILNSQTFQLSSIPVEDTKEAAKHFAHYPLRRMEAEVLIDALNLLTHTQESYSSPIPEPFSFIPENIRAIALADGSITSSFLELFGRPPRDTGYESERSRNISDAQRLHLLNSTHVHKKVKASPLVAAAHDGESSPSEIADKVYHTVLSRPPTEEEVNALKAHSEEDYQGARELASDLVWALINQPEFYFIH